MHRARSLAEADDIQPRIMKASSGLERLADTTPDMFEDISDEELAKYDKFLLEMDDVARKQSELLSNIEVGVVTGHNDIHNQLWTLYNRVKMQSY